MAVPAFKAVWGAIALSPVGSIPTPSAKNVWGVITMFTVNHRQIGKVAAEEFGDHTIIDMPLDNHSPGVIFGFCLAFAFTVGPAARLISKLVADEEPETEN